MAWTGKGKRMLNIRRTVILEQLAETRAGLKAAASELNSERHKRMEAEKERDSRVELSKRSLERMLEVEGKLKQAQTALEGNDRLCSILIVALEHYQRMAGEIK